MDITLVWMAVGLGCIWQGAQIIWVAPKPSQFQKKPPQLEVGSAQAFQQFWLDQYGWIGITLVVSGLVIVLVGVLS